MKSETRTGGVAPRPEPEVLRFDDFMESQDPRADFLDSWGAPLEETPAAEPPRPDTPKTR